MEFVQNEPISSMIALDDKAMPIHWTNEKHSLYLKSMEASFVEHLYNSMDLLGGRWRKAYDSVARSSKPNDCHMTDQFKVHQNGSWKKFDFGRDEPLHKIEDEYGLLLSNPWIRHFTSGRGQDVAPTTSQESVGTGSQLWSYGMKQLSRGSEDVPKQFSLHSHDQCSTYSNEEASGQNFVDEVEEDEQEADDSAHRRKRSRTS